MNSSRSILINRLLLFIVFFITLWLLLTTPSVLSQVLYGLITGTVSDATGGVLPSTEISIVNIATNYTQVAITNEVGSYLLPNLPGGNYTLTVILLGFKEYVVENVVVTAGSVTRKNIDLQLGEITEQITVTAGSAVLQTDTTDVHAKFEMKEITELPISRYRNYQSLISLTPGATNGAIFNSLMDSPTRALTWSFNGTNYNNNNTRIDGARSMNLWLTHLNAYIPPTETIEVVAISTNNFDAEQGFAGGAATTVITKSGTNQFHGSVFAHHENSVLAAREFFTIGENPTSIRNIDGFTVGGPIKQNKIFFFVGWEGMFERLAKSAHFTVATEDQRRGDFSAYPTTIYDPSTGNPDGTGRTPFPGNVIPEDRMSSASLKMQSLIPFPNLPGVLRNYFTTATQRFDRHNIDAKIDWYRSDVHRIWGKFSVMDALVECQYGLDEAGGIGLCDGYGSGQSNTTTKVIGLGHNWSLSPSFLIDGNFGFTHRDMGITPPSLALGNFGIDVLGIPGTNGSDPRTCPDNWCAGMPSFSFEGYTPLGDFPLHPWFSDDFSATFTTNFSWSRNSHELRWGFDMARHSLDHWNPAAGAGPRGYFLFTGTITGLNSEEAPLVNMFNSYAAFLLGLPRQMKKDVQWERKTSREWQFAWYFRDRWQLTPKLTFTLGLRYEYFPLLSRADRGLERMDFDTMQVLLGGLGGNEKNLGVEVSNMLFAPRIGLAYRIDESTVVRAGYGITNNPMPFSRPLRDFYPVTIASVFEVSNPYEPWRTLAEGIPDIEGPDLSSGIVDPPVNVFLRSMPAGKLHRGYIQSWNLMFERKLPAELLLSLGYIGNQTVRSFADNELNWSPPRGGNEGRQLYAEFGRTVSTVYWDGWLSANYHSFQLALNRRFTDGLFVKAAYTWSKAINMTDQDGDAGLQWNDPSILYRNRAQAGYNIPHILRLAVLYELPFGQDPGFVNFLIRGWQVNSIFSINQQRAFTVTDDEVSTYLLNAKENIQTADQVKPKIEKLDGIGPGQPYYDPTAFLLPPNKNNPNRRRPDNGVCTYRDREGKVTSIGAANECYGNSGRNILRGPAWVNLDLSLFRNFQLTEGLALEFRAEAFNFTNTPKFANPNQKVYSEDFMCITKTNPNASPRVIRFGFKLKF